MRNEFLLHKFCSVCASTMYAAENYMRIMGLYEGELIKSDLQGNYVGF